MHPELRGLAGVLQQSEQGSNRSAPQVSNPVQQHIRHIDVLTNVFGQPVSQQLRIVIAFKEHARLFPVQEIRWRIKKLLIDVRNTVLHFVIGAKASEVLLVPLLEVF